MGKLSMKLKIVINYLKSLKKSKLHIDKDIYNAARYKVRKIILKKKKKKNQVILLVKLKIYGRY